MRVRSFRGVIVLSTVALMTVAMVLVAILLQVVLARTADHDLERVLAERAETTISVVDQASSGGLRVPADGIQPGVLVLDADGVVVAGSVGPDARATAEGLGSVTSTRVVRGPGDRTRLLAEPFTTTSGQRGVIVVMEETAPYERAELYTLLATGGLAVLVIAATALIALRVTRQALAPVQQMAARAADWSEHDLTHRFDLGPPANELSALGATLDHLLDRVGAAILAEQRLTSELAHELRTPLTAIQGSAGLALLRGVDDPATRADLEQIVRSCEDLSAVIAALLDVARSGSTSGTETCTLGDVAALLVLPSYGDLRVDGGLQGSTLRVAAPAALVARVLQPILDNAGQHARSCVALDADERGGRVVVTITDDGEGVADDDRERLFEPGVGHRSGGAGLGLGIARRVASAIGAEIEVGRPGSGAAFVVTLPVR